MSKRRKRKFSTAHLTKKQLRSGTLTAFHGQSPAEPESTRDAEELAWRRVWGVTP